MKMLEDRKSGAYLGVCEHFAGKADAEIALLDRFYITYISRLVL